MFAWDKYLFGEFFNDRSEVLDIVGSSAGAFRAACFGQADPVAAIERLAKNYSETVYSKQVDRAEISEKAMALLEVMLGERGVREIIDNPIFKAHFIVAKSRGFSARENKAIQGLGLVRSYINNRIDRKHLAKQFERYIFRSQGSRFEFTDPDNIPTQTVDLTEVNLKPALLASGSIPMVMSGIRDIPGCPTGMYRDGGIIDYHFDMKISGPDLVLYPHFNADPKAGWFDKRLNRPVRKANYDNVVMICPSEEFIASLPYGKIPDRTDFSVLEDADRISYWRQVFKDSERLAEELDTVIRTQDLSSVRLF